MLMFEHTEMIVGDAKIEQRAGIAFYFGTPFIQSFGSMHVALL
jgi:hypothetical protein